MPDIRKRATFYAARKRKPETFHIETDGAVVNITVGLTDREGRHVTRVDISPEDETRSPDLDGYYWHRPEGDARIIRRDPEIGDPVTETERYTFEWSTKHGTCHDCGRAAAFHVDVDGTDEDLKVCAVCAANHAADGDTVRRIDTEI